MNRSEFARNTHVLASSVFDPDALAGHLQAARQGDAQAGAQIAAAMAACAFSAPAATQRIYDVLAYTWLAQPLPEVTTQVLPAAPLEADFWAAFWSVIDDAEQGYDAGSITARVAALGGAVNEGFGLLAETCAATHPGGANAGQQAMPGRTDLSTLADCADNTLGQTLYRMIVENGYDLEVLDREAIMLGDLPPALRFLNTRILQMHDVWHLVAGYQTTASHEIAISAFQLAQFGHNYSAMFLATVLAISLERNPQGFPILMQLICEAWVHGRQTPALMAVEWESEWSSSIADIRSRYGIRELESVFPADLFESMQPAAAEAGAG